MSTVSLFSARPMLALAGLALFAAGCGGDNQVPFNASGTNDDIAALESGFDSPATQSFTYFADAMDGVFGAPMVSSSLTLVQNSAHKDGMLASARSATASIRSMTAPRSKVPLAIIPPEYLGDTYTYDSATDEYVLSERTGAPANGVRFIVYSVNPITGVPTEPLQEVGYADLLDESTATSDALRVLLASDGVTYLDYGVTGIMSSSSAEVTIDGFATNGATRVNFLLQNTASDAANGTLTYDYELDVPSRDLEVNYLITVTGLSTAVTTGVVDLALSGPNGAVGVEGSVTDGDGELTATVNGDDFAVMTLLDEDVASVTAPDGSALTPAELGVFVGIWALVYRGFDIFEDLLDPIDNIL